MTSTTLQCVKCGRPFLDEERITSISGSIMGDEYTDVYYLCPVCRVYSVATWRDNFTGIETMHLSGPVSMERGNELVEQIRKCSRPWDKKCRCEAHRSYFNDSLD